jgi:hypothetical protein
VPLAGSYEVRYRPDFGMLWWVSLTGGPENLTFWSFTPAMRPDCLDDQRACKARVARA